MLIWLETEKINFNFNFIIYSMKFFKYSIKNKHVLAVSSAMFKFNKNIIERKIDDLRILLIKREAEPYINKYALPGGKINDNEVYLDATKRECLEETGYNIDIPKNHLIKLTYLKHYLIITSLAYIKNDEPEKCEDIVKEFKTYEEILEMPNRVFVTGIKDVILDSFEFFDRNQEFF